MFSCRLSICILIIPIISSCTALEEMAKKAEVERLISVRAACEMYGFKPNTDALAQCVQAEINNIENRSKIESEADETRSTMEDEAKKTRSAIEDAAKNK